MVELLFLVILYLMCMLFNTYYSILFDLKFIYCKYNKLCVSFTYKFYYL